MPDKMRHAFLGFVGVFASFWGTVAVLLTGVPGFHQSWAQVGLCLLLTLLGAINFCAYFFCGKAKGQQ